MCTHLVAEHPPGSFRVLTGAGMDYHLLCAECVDAEAPLIEVCEGCADNASEWDSVLGWRGEPEIKRHDRELGGTWLTWDSPIRPVNDRCLAPLPGGSWLALTADGLVEIDGIGEHRLLTAVELPDEAPSEWAGRVRSPALHTSADGGLVAVVTNYGRYGTVLERGSGDQILALDREDYYNKTTPFPFAFIGEGPETTVIAATDWNRLDAFDATGRLLTDRVTSHQDNRDHYLDYFHGALSPSPSGRFLLTDGWVWHPVGVPMVFDVGAWMAGDTHAAEHGVSLCQRDYAWDQPIAWVDDDLVAIQRIGADDEQMVDGIELYDIHGTRKGMFAGPSGPMWAHRGLLHVAAEGGFEIWDPVEGARIGLCEGFTPTAHRDGVFAELGNGQLRIWTSTR